MHFQVVVFPLSCWFSGIYLYPYHLRWAVLPFFPFCKYCYIWHDMHGCRGWGELGQTMTSGSWFMLIFKLIVSVFLDGAVVVVVVVAGFVVCFFVRWCFCCGCCCYGFCCFCVSLFVFCFLCWCCCLCCMDGGELRPWKRLGMNKTQGREISCQ